ncbi:unnamed protein product [Penicillium salamii]|nr:unnamed protein product [Penicillium salamii]CAG8404746.1 unnamed protein product [Penicillium salamii]
MVHHMLAIYALGASPDQIQIHHDREIRVLLPAHSRDLSIIESLYENERFIDHLGELPLYHSYLTFFEKEIASKGAIQTMVEYLFVADERAEAMMPHLFTGMWHPWIHLGYALEFQQPLLMAEALAQIATHPTWGFETVLLPAEKIPRRNENKRMIEIMDDMRKDEKLMAAPLALNLNKMFDIFDNAPNEMIKYAIQFTVSVETLDDRVAELIETAAYCLACSQRPGKAAKFDFFLLHGLTSSIFLSNIIYHPSLDLRTKVRLVEWKGRSDLIIWASCKCPKLYPSRLQDHGRNKTWDELISWALNHPEEDSHFSKSIRALMHGERICHRRRSEGKTPRLMVDDEIWLKAGNMRMFILI